MTTIQNAEHVMAVDRQRERERRDRLQLELEFSADDMMEPK